MRQLVQRVTLEQAHNSRHIEQWSGLLQSTLLKVRSIITRQSSNNTLLFIWSPTKFPSRPRNIYMLPGYHHPHPQGEQLIRALWFLSYSIQICSAICYSTTYAPAIFCSTKSHTLSCTSVLLRVFSLICRVSNSTIDHKMRAFGFGVADRLQWIREQTISEINGRISVCMNSQGNWQDLVDYIKNEDNYATQVIISSTQTINSIVWWHHLLHNC